MKSHGLGLLMAFAAAAACAAPLPFTAGPESFDREGGHIQGIAASEDALYVAQMTRLVKFDWNGKVLATRAALSHTGDIAWHDGELYAAVAVYPESREGRIQVYDKDLNLLREASVDRAIDGIAYVDGVLYVGMGAKTRTSKAPHRVNILGRFDAKTLKEVAPRMEFDYGYDTKYGFQNIAFDGKMLIASFYAVDGAPGVAFFDRELRVLGTASEKCSQGFDILPQSMRAGGPRFVRATTTIAKRPASVTCGFDFVDLRPSVCPRWISVMPMRDDCAAELAADAADLGNTTFIDGILWSCPVNPGGDPPADKGAIFAKKWRTVSALVREKSQVRQGILLQSTMGHGGFPGTPTPWQLAVKADGTSVYRMCPMDERFLAYIAKTCREISDAKPDFFMVDDDTRIVWDDIPGCFCPLHLAEFAKRTGRSWTRDDVVAMLKKGDSQDARTWEDVKVDSLRRFFRTIRENFERGIPGTLCVVGAPQHLKHAREFAQILAAPGQTPVVRGSGAPYHGRNLFHIVSTRSSYARQMELVGGDVAYLQESDTCPHTQWATSAVRMFDHLVMLALEGCKGAKIWITRTGNYHEKKSAEAYRRIFRENKGLVEWIARTGFRQRGVVIPVCGPSSLNFADRYFAFTGLPYRFGKAAKGEVTALTADTLKLLKPEEIREILSGSVLADASASLWLSENGYSGDTGVRAKPWKRKTIQIHEFEDGFRQSGMRTGELVDLSDTDPGAKVLTKLFNVPVAGAAPVFEASGSVLFANSRGGKVLSMAQKAPMQDPPYYAATLLSERYREEIANWLRSLGGGTPGGARYLGVGSVTCMAGSTEADGNVFVINVLDLDGDPAPEMAFDADPVSVERLSGDGSWKKVEFTATGKGRARIASPVATQIPAIFRWR